MDSDPQDFEARLRALEDACQVSLSSPLMRDVLNSLSANESLQAFIQKAVSTELIKRDPNYSASDKKLSVQKPSIQNNSTSASLLACANGEIPVLSKEMAVKTHEEDLSVIDRQVIESIVLRELASGLLKEHMDAMPRALHAMMEYDVMSSHWFPRDDWNELMHDFLDNGLNYTLDTWIEMRRQKRLEDEADAWIQLGREDD